MSSAPSPPTPLAPPEAPGTPEASEAAPLLPGGWDVFFLALAVVLLAVGYWMGLRSAPPQPAPHRAEVHAGPLPARVDD